MKTRPCLDAVRDEPLGSTIATLSWLSGSIDSVSAELVGAATSEMTAGVGSGSGVASGCTADIEGVGAAGGATDEASGADEDEGVGEAVEDENTYVKSELIDSAVDFVVDRGATRVWGLVSWGSVDSVLFAIVFVSGSLLFAAS